MDINQRFAYIISELYSGNKRAFSKAIGVSPTVIENVVGKRQGNPSFEVIQKVICANANISAEWLITGNGLMFSKNEIRIPDSEPAPEALVKNLLDMIERKDQKIIDQAEEIGKLKNEVSILKKQGKSTNYLSVAEP